MYLLLHLQLLDANLCKFKLYFLIILLSFNKILINYHIQQFLLITIHLIIHQLILIIIILFLLIILLYNL